MTIKICVDCKWFYPCTGIGAVPLCTTPERRDFSPVYGWQQKSVSPEYARKHAADCGMRAKWYEARN